MQLDEYNGWENMFTWLIDAHLSNDAAVMDAITGQIEHAIDENNAGIIIEMWVKKSITDWLTFFAGRNKMHDEEMRLLAWDLLKSALAYADWESVIAMLASGVETSDNLFSLTLYKGILNNAQLHQDIGILIENASSIYTAADAVKDWFEMQLETWITTTAARRHQNSPMSTLARELIKDTYDLIYWRSVAKMFRPD